MPEPKEISFELLLDWVEGRLQEEESRTVEEQLAVADESTLAEVEWLRAFVRTSEDTVLDAPPPEVREILTNRFRAYAEERLEPGFFRRILATLTFDSDAGMALAGVRSAGVEDSRQLVYSVEVAEIALNIQKRPGDGKLDLYGQVLPTVEESPEAFSVQLLRDAQEVGLTAADDLGEFAFEDIPPGVYDIVLSAAQVEFHVTPVRLSG
jgi:hypothetical protein